MSKILNPPNLTAANISRFTVLFCKLEISILHILNLTTGLEYINVIELLLIQVTWSGDLDQPCRGMDGDKEVKCELTIKEKELSKGKVNFYDVNSEQYGVKSEMVRFTVQFAGGILLFNKSNLSDFCSDSTYHYSIFNQWSLMNKFIMKEEFFKVMMMLKLKLLSWLQSGLK